MDLSNELVESFLSWNGRSNGEMLGNNSLNGIGSSQGAKVKQTILAMKKCGKLSTMADIYREKLCDTIRVTIRTTVTECAADAAKDASLIPAASATIVQIPDKSSAGKESKDDSGAPKSSIIEGVVSMSFDQFMECLDMIYEHTLSLLKSAAGVNKFCLEEGISFKDDDVLDNGEGVDSTKNTSSSTTPSALTAGADLSHRSLSEILRLRKDTHSLITFDEMRRLWDSCIAFTLQLERISGQKAYVLRSTLLSQAKAFVERKHEANMSSLAAALDSERWTQCDVSAHDLTLTILQIIPNLMSNSYS
jgi:vacuolar protein sorting-associated protein 54